MEQERDELREALDILEAHLGTRTSQYDSEDGTQSSRVKKSTVARALRSVSRKTEPRPQEPEIVDLSREQSVAERVARMIAQQSAVGGVAHHLKSQETSAPVASPVFQIRQVGGEWHAEW